MNRQQEIIRIASQARPHEATRYGAYTCGYLAEWVHQLEQDKAALEETIKRLENRNDD